MCDNHFQGMTDNIYDFCRRFCSLFFIRSPVILLLVHHSFNRPKDGWRGLVVKLWADCTCICADIVKWSTSSRPSVITTAHTEHTVLRLRCAADISDTE